MYIGRKKELKRMRQLLEQQQANLVVVKGRRRVGKSRLIAESAKNRRFLSFTGLAPIDHLTAQDQRDAFARQLAAQLKSAPFTFTDWSDAFNYISHQLDKQPTVILLDEISWMADKDPTFIPKLKVWWDLDLQNRSHLMLVFCGSVSTWIEENILNSTAFFGRISFTITLEPLSLPECGEFLRTIGFKGSPYEIYKLLSVTGGIPWYLEQIFSSDMADQNIKRLCFEREGLLTTEFDHIFHDLFNKKGVTYKKILQCLKTGMKTLAEIRSELKATPSGTLSKMMEQLISCEFVSRTPQWSIKTENLRKQSLYRISDPYIRFYLKYIEKNRARIQQNYYSDLELNDLPEFGAMMGFQVENLLLQNRPLLLQAMDIKPAEVLFDNTYQQQATAARKGCQVDYLVQTRTNNLYLCEFKFSRNVLGKEIIDEVREKIKRLKIPRGFAIVPVLFHLGGVTEAVLESRFFFRVIDIANFLDAR